MSSHRCNISEDIGRSKDTGMGVGEKWEGKRWTQRQMKN